MQLPSTQHLSLLERSFYESATVVPLRNPRLVVKNEELLLACGITEDEILPFMNAQKENLFPYAYAYSGHQFGYFVPNLGDGRAINYGVLGGWHLQTKGSGRTKYSRDGDGRAVLRSSIREFLASEAMHALDIPTTRALALITSDTPVYREKEERASIVLRASYSWIRFGSFEFAYLGSRKKERLTIMADFLISQSFQELQDADGKYEKLFFAICDATQKLLVKWQSIGFMHGVMNSDNMSALGVTIDYGPYAFMERFDRKFIPNSSDYEGRYSFENQPFIAQWNLLVLARAMSPIADFLKMQEYAEGFLARFKRAYVEQMSKKIGLFTPHAKDRLLIDKLLQVLELAKEDYTHFFYQLSHANFDSFRDMGVQEWLVLYKERLLLESCPDEQRLREMQKINPKYVLKNYMLQEAIERAECEDFSLVQALYEIAKDPFAPHEAYERYAKPSEPHAIFVCSCSS